MMVDLAPNAEITEPDEQIHQIIAWMSDVAMQQVLIPLDHLLDTVEHLPTLQLQCLEPCKVCLRIRWNAQDVDTGCIVNPSIELRKALAHRLQSNTGSATHLTPRGESGMLPQGWLFDLTWLEGLGY